MNSVWDWLQQKQIYANAQRASDAGFDARAALTRVQELETRLDRLSLLCRALAEELEHASGVSEEQLKARMLEIDLRDGKEDGKYDPRASVTCTGCGRTVVNRRGSCMWCGEKL
ncbi:MAG: hypothetical protein ACREVL_09135 [Solimonas sp.]